MWTVDVRVLGGRKSWDDEQLPDGTAHQVVIIAVGIHVGGNAVLIENWLVCLHRKCSSRAKQDRVFEVLLASGPALFEDISGLSDFVLAPNVHRNMESGAYLA